VVILALVGYIYIRSWQEKQLLFSSIRLRWLWAVGPLPFKVAVYTLKLGEAVRQGGRLRHGAAALPPGAPRMCEPCTPPDALLETVRGLRVADPDLGPKPLLAKLRAQQLDSGAGTREVREALVALKAESEAKEAAAAPPAVATPPAADKGGAPSHAALSLACYGCARLPSEMGDDREKHPVCPKCVKRKLQTTY